MELDRLRDHWDKLGRRDPLWAVLTAPGREHGGWDPGELLQGGREEVAGYLDMLEAQGLSPGRGRALDFGCGVGRHAQALAEHFERVDGVDIAPSMIDAARRLNRHGERCVYHVNDSPNLALFDDASFDLVLSVLVLQHMEVHYALAYVQEFIRLLRPGGVALFQLPARRLVDVPTPLPPEARRAAFAVDGPPPRLGPGERTGIKVRVRNDSPVTWPAGAGLRLGNHWRDLSGRALVVSDGHVDMPRELGPEEELTLPLEVTAPNVSGPWVLELDMVQEPIGWFRRWEEEKFQLVIDPVPGLEAPAGSAAEGTAERDFTPWIEMYAVPKAEVIALIESCGGEVLHTFEDAYAGAGYESHHYVVGPVPPAATPTAVNRLAGAVAEVPDRPDMLPPLVSDRGGAGRLLELLFKRLVARATRWLTFLQVRHDRAVARALREAHTALAAQEAEIRALREELRRRPPDRPRPGGPDC